MIFANEVCTSCNICLLFDPVCFICLLVSSADPDRPNKTSGYLDPHCLTSKIVFLKGFLKLNKKLKNTSADVNIIIIMKITQHSKC